MATPMARPLGGEPRSLLGDVVLPLPFPRRRFRRSRDRDSQRPPGPEATPPAGSSPSLVLCPTESSRRQKPRSVGRGAVWPAEAGLRSVQQPCDRERKRGRRRRPAAQPRLRVRTRRQRAPGPVSARTAAQGLGRSGVLKVQLKPPAAGAKEGEVVSGCGTETGLLRTEHEPC